MALCPIKPLERLPSLTPSCPSGEASAAGGGTFDQVLNRVLGGAASADAQATQAINDLATGEAEDLHTASLAIAQADLTFRLALAIRNRLIEAYQEISRLQV